jgi:integrase
VPADRLTFLVTETGQPFTAGGFGNWFGDCARRAGLTGCTAHGLRKVAARRLAESGGSAHEIMAVTGHQSLKEVVIYTKAADQVRLAARAASAIGGAKQNE